MSTLADRMREYEAIETERKLIPLLPIYIRLDGNCFKHFTRNMERPFDYRMVYAMQQTTKHILNFTNANIGYTQSDEINLVIQHGESALRNFEHGAWFKNRIYKLTSILSGLTSSVFLSNYIKIFDVDIDSLERFPAFDCKVINLPNEIEVANMILWRNADATKNAITLAALQHFTNSELLHKNGSEKQEMLFSKGINFDDYPETFKRGSFIRKVWKEHYLKDEEWEKIPDDEKPVSRMIERKFPEVISMPIFSKVINREDVIFRNAEPKRVSE